MLSLGETGELSPNASAMLRISTLSAWAQLQVASTQQSYLQQVVQPYRPVLSSLWIASLRDYASIRVDSEFLGDMSSVSIDSSYSSLGKEVLLPVRLLLISQLFISPAFIVLHPILANHSVSRCQHHGSEGPSYPCCDGRKGIGTQREATGSESIQQRASGVLLYCIRLGLRGPLDIVGGLLPWQWTTAVYRHPGFESAEEPR